MELALDTIIIDEELRIRPLHPDVVDHYADILSELPPVDVFVVGEEYFLAGGFHRLAAAQQLDWEQIPVTLHHGIREDALVFALTANATHGLPLSKEEERQAILRLATILRHGKGDPRLSEIARQMGRSLRFVDTVLRARLVQQAVPFAGILQPRKLEEISRAPAATWEPLTSAAYHGHWDTAETSRRVQQINAGKPLDEVIDRPMPEYIAPEQPTPDPEHDNLEDYMELSRAMGRFDPYLTVGRYDWRDVPLDEGRLLCGRLGMMRLRIERVMAFLMGQGYEPEGPSDEERELLEVAGE